MGKYAAAWVGKGGVALGRGTRVEKMIWPLRDCIYRAVVTITCKVQLLLFLFLFFFILYFCGKDIGFWGCDIFGVFIWEKEICFTVVRRRVFTRRRVCLVCW